jgi:hypothetical protein
MSRAARLALFVLATAVLGLAQASNSSGAGQPVNQQVSPDSAQGSSNANPGMSVGEVDAGTEIHATLDTPLSTRTSKAGDRFTATIADEVRGPDNGALVIPGGARVEGEVADAEEGKTVAALKGKGKLSLRFRDVVLPNGQTLPLTATLISVHDTSAHNASGKITKKANAEGIQPRTDTSQTIGAGSGNGASAGLTFGGPVKGLAIGALAGGGYVLSISSKDVNLPAQTGMVIRLDQSVSWNGTSASIHRLLFKDKLKLHKQTRMPSAIATAFYC